MESVQATARERSTQLNPELRYQVHCYMQGKRGTWVYRFETREQAEAFAKGKTLWGRPAAVKEVSE